jgi:hypothetical protein
MRLLRDTVELADYKPPVADNLLSRDLRLPSRNGYDVDPRTPIRGIALTDNPTLAEIDKQIQIVEDNLRELIEQAAAYSGAADEERNANRIAGQQAKLDALLKERETLLR